MRWVMAEKERTALGAVARGMARVAMRKDIVVIGGVWFGVGVVDSEVIVSVMSLEFDEGASKI
jgi:hypothetical protein